MPIGIPFGLSPTACDLLCHALESVQPAPWLALIEVIAFPDRHMASLKSNSNASHRRRLCRGGLSRAVGLSRAATALVLFSLCFCLTLSGCQRVPGGHAMRQYQMESDRLLAEFRAQKKRAEDLEARNVQLEQRLAESEKMLARNMSGTSGRGVSGSANGTQDSKLMIGGLRSDRTGSDYRSNDRNALNNLSEFNSSRSSSPYPSSSSSSSRGPIGIQRGGLPDSTPSTSGRLTAGNRNDPISLGNGPRDLRGDPKGDAQWRPVHRGQ